jgi:hypothetical protein
MRLSQERSPGEYFGQPVCDGNNPTQAFLGVAVVALGFPVYLFLFRNKRLVERGSLQ